MNNLDHPCKQTCSGWQQGYEKGVETLRAENIRLVEALQHYADPSKWNVSEPMKSLGWTPDKIVKEARAQALVEVEKAKDAVIDAAVVQVQKHALHTVGGLLNAIDALAEAKRKAD